jgi:hypothetical protein
VEAATRTQPSPAGPVYARRQPEKTVLYRAMQEHLLTFEQEWTEEASGRTLPKFVTDELHGFLGCGIAGRGFAHLFCKTCREHHVVGGDGYVVLDLRDSLRQWINLISTAGRGGARL